MAVTPEQNALAKHRIERAEATLNEASDEFSLNNSRLAVNSAYYSFSHHTSVPVIAYI